jgi:hypothetical protein
MLVILTEEPSMKTFLDILIPRFYPDLVFKTIPHRGKQDLEKHLPKFLRSWKVPDSKFIVVHDQDNWDCYLLKAELQAKCDAIRPDVVVRIVCTELEAWYWGDLLAVAQAFEKPKLPALARKSKYRIPDSIVSPKEELQNKLPHYEQLNGAKMIAEHADIERNTSHSFHVFIESLQKLS